MSNTLLRCCAIFALLLAFAGCDTRRSDIVGKWKVDGPGDMSWEFHANGSVTSGGAPGRYTFGDNDRLKITTPTATFVYQLELNGDRMTWRDPSGARTELTRVK